MTNWLPDLLAVLGLILWGIAAFCVGGTVALLVYCGVICILLAGAIAWKHSA